MRSFITLGSIFVSGLLLGAVPLISSDVSGSISQDLPVENSPVAGARHMNDRIKQDLLRLIHKHSLKKIHVRSEIGDSESMDFAKEIRSYLKSMAIEVEEAEVKSRAPQSGIQVAIKDKVGYLTIGSND